MKKSLVSVVIITYNHENFIREAIEGVLMQTCDFDMELIVANDCSTDKTDEVILDIIKNHPRASWIKYTKQDLNSGMMPNFIFALQECKGKYIALCEGDDYWTDPLKLQKQVDFLGGNSDYVLSFHNAEVIDLNTTKRRLFINKYKKNDYLANDILNSWIIPTASMVFKNVFKNGLPSFFLNSTHGDLALQVYLCEFGKTRVIDEVMSVYRINEKSITVTSFSGIKHNQKHIKQLEEMNIFFEQKYENEINRRKFLFLLENANCYKGEDIVMQLFWFLRSVVFNPLLAYRFKMNVINSFKSIGVTLMILLRIKGNIDLKSKN
jgi:glycosyltransferase involved in cell wall biosynthesis